MLQYIHYHFYFNKEVLQYMTPFNKVKNLYDYSILTVNDSKSPLIHYNSESADKVHKSSFKEIISSILSNPNNSVPISICDIGCATGDILSCLNQSELNKINYSGLELNEKFIMLAKSQFSNHNNINFYQYNIYNMNLSHNYDIITIYDTFAYFNTKEIINMIDYYYSKSNHVLSFILLDEFDNYDKSLLIQYSNPSSIINHCKSSFPNSVSYKFFNLDKSNIFYIVNISKDNT